MNRLIEIASSKTAAFVLLCSVSALVAGCSSSQFLGAPDNSPILAAALNGKVHGGQQPITGASVQLWAVGSSGYGSAATKLGSSVSSDASGNFSLGAYTCPTPSTLTYITASGGNPGVASANTSIMLAAALGACGNLNSGTFIFMDEVTTAAAAYALGQYFTPAVGGPSTADSFGAPTNTQAQTGITNAFATVNSLVCGVSTNAVCSNNATGNAVTSATFSNTINSSTVTVTATPESAKLNTAADILAACVNSLGVSDPGGACTTLFNDVTPTGSAAPTDTLQAAVYMSLNPTSNNANGSSANLAALYALVTGTAPYVGVSSQPTDWTVGILYTGPAALPDPQNLAVDASGNVWIINANGNTDNLAEINNSGTPQAIAAATAAQRYRSNAIDTNGNVWFGTASSPSTAFEYTTGGSLLSSVTFGSPYAVAINGNNDVFFGRNSGTACNGTSTNLIGEFTAGTLASTNLVSYLCPTATAFTFAYAVADTSNNLWITNGAGAGGTGIITEVTSVPSDATVTTSCTAFPCTASTGGPTLTYTTITGGAGGVPTLATPFGIATGLGGSNIWLANQTGNNLTKMTSATAGTNFGDATSLNKPTFVAVDGSGNVWVTNNVSGPSSVSEFSNSGAVLSPVNTTTAPFTAIGFLRAGLATPSGIATDPSGNVWVANNTASGGVFEIVGAAAPTVTPISLALKNNSVGQKP
ncbi:MAG TPA: hypothetical protein VGN01_13565 [Acidobacteriaceae bacterium]